MRPASRTADVGDIVTCTPSRPSAAKAASISRLVLALRTSISSPRARVAASTSLSVDGVFGTFVGLTSTATRAAASSRSRKSPRRFATRIAARPCQAVDQTQLDRVFADAEHDRDRRGRSFGGDRSKVAGGCGNDGHTTTREVGHQSRQAIELTLQPMVLHRHVLALDVAGFVEALAEPSNKGRVRQSGIDEADHRHRPLLRARRERPWRCRAAKQRYELATLETGFGASWQL